MPDCDVCNKPFKKKWANQKHCSPDCARKKQTQQSKAYYRDNYERLKKDRKKRYAKEKKALARRNKECQ